MARQCFGCIIIISIVRLMAATRLFRFSCTMQSNIPGNPYTISYFLAASFQGSGNEALYDELAHMYAQMHFVPERVQLQETDLIDVVATYMYNHRFISTCNVMPSK